MSLEKTEMSLEEIKILAENVLLNNGCNQNNALAIAETVFKAERDGSESHGLFRIPGYVNSLKSGKVKGDAEPSIENELKSVITVDGNHGYAPLSLKIGLPYLTKAALSNGIAVMKVINSFHFAALWPETEYLAENNLVSLACTAYKPSVAPYGTKNLFLAQTQFHLLGQDQEKLLLFLIWQLLHWPRGMLWLLHEMDMKYQMVLV